MLGLKTLTSEAGVHYGKPNLVGLNHSNCFDNCSSPPDAAKQDLKYHLIAVQYPQHFVSAFASRPE